MTRHGDAVTVTAPVTVLHPTKDGAFGMTCDSWAQGIREVNGGFFPAPRGKAGGDLAQALHGALALFPGEDECDSARLAGEAYARANRGRTLDSYDFARWLGSGRPVRNPPKAAGPLDPELEKRDLAKTMRDADARVLAAAAAKGIR